MRRFAAVFGLCCAAAAAPAPSPAPPAAAPAPVPAPSPAAAAEEAVRRTVFNAYKAGLVKHDLAAFLAAFADDAVLTGGRGEKPDRHDVVLDRKKIEATRRMLFRGQAPAGYLLEFDAVSVKVDGDAAELRHLATHRTGRDLLQYEEVDRLRLTEGGWRIREGRWWPLLRRSGTETVVYKDETWKDLDAKAEKARQEPWPALPFALCEAYRFAEAHAVARERTERKEAVALDWIGRGGTALQAGEAGDAQASFDKALALDPDAPVPPWGRKETGK
jgi:hypothetical protein